MYNTRPSTTRCKRHIHQCNPETAHIAPFSQSNHFLMSSLLHTQNPLRSVLCLRPQLWSILIDGIHFSSDKTISQPLNTVHKRNVQMFLCHTDTHFQVEHLIGKHTSRLSESGILMEMNYKHVIHTPENGPSSYSQPTVAKYSDYAYRTCNNYHKCKGMRQLSDNSFV